MTVCAETASGMLTSVGVLHQVAARQVGVGGADVGRAVGRARDARARAGGRGRHRHPRVLLVVGLRPGARQRVEQAAARLGDRRACRLLGRHNAGRPAGARAARRRCAGRDQPREHHRQYRGDRDAQPPGHGPPEAVLFSPRHRGRLLTRATRQAWWCRLTRYRSFFPPLGAVGTTRKMFTGSSPKVHRRTGVRPHGQSSAPSRLPG